MSAATPKPIRLRCYLPPTVCRKQSEFVWSRQSRHIPAAVRIGFECLCNGQSISNRIFRDVTPLWDQRDKNYHKRDLKPKLWDEIGEKLNVTGNLIHYFSNCVVIHPK